MCQWVWIQEYFLKITSNGQYQCLSNFPLHLLGTMRITQSQVFPSRTSSTYYVYVYFEKYVENYFEKYFENYFEKYEFKIQNVIKWHLYNGNYTVTSFPQPYFLYSVYIYLEKYELKIQKIQNMIRLHLYNGNYTVTESPQPYFTVFPVI